MTNLQAQRKRVFKLAHRLKKDEIMRVYQKGGASSISTWSELLKKSWMIIKQYVPGTIQTIVYDWYKKELKGIFNLETEHREVKIVLVPVKEKIVLRKF